MENAKVVAFNGHGELMRLMEIPIPEPTDGEILVRNLYTTICGSDLHTYRGLRTEKTPTVLGHEIVGEILAIGPKHSQRDYKGDVLRIGDRVTWSIFSSYTNSMMAQKGMPQKAEKLFKYGHAQINGSDALHGGLSTHCILKEGTAVLKVSTEIPLPVAATINCAIATVAGGLRLAGDIKNKNVLISGAGLLGIICVAMCKVGGAKNIQIADMNAERLKKAYAFGADLTLALQEDKVLDMDGVDIAFDMSGSPEAMEWGMNALAVGGTAIWIGAVLNTRPIHVDAERVIRRILKIKGLHNYNFDDFVFAVDFISKHYQTFPFTTIVEKEFFLEEAEAAFQYAVTNKPLRVGIRTDLTRLA